MDERLHSMNWRPGDSTASPETFKRVTKRRLKSECPQIQELVHVDVPIVANIHLRRYLALLLTSAWAAQIFWLSTESFGSGHSKSMLLALLNFLDVNVSSEILEVLNSILRKFAHVAEYAVLSILLYFLFLSCDRFGWRIRSAYWSIVGASAYALTDEFHQLFVHGRGASVVDCLIDVTGAAAGMLVIYLCLLIIDHSRGGRSALFAAQ